ncbi:mycothiol synthase [Brachybacterium endophyticum]|uniref:Mycothiol acetyltransferase n=1 Tax=Brachybacterium endophyticum TaxID=2182385 RepID=A0A2U2RKX2_9MICO|nr:mycothiol synthase [Brachybacterium endophyticum]PWH06528.1 mycothiol synthase [Brachybacterium endophyticum]
MIVTDELPPELIPAVDLLLERSRAHDGAAALDEAARFALHGESSEGALHLLLTEDGENSRASARVLGYVSVLTDGTTQGTVDPDRRRRGLGAELLAEALSRRPDAGVWAHGALEDSVRFLRAHGLEAVRELLTMSRPLGEGAPAVPVREPRDERIELSTFDPERDADAWVRVNARAFADHPEQGRLTRADLEARMAEPWFDAEDFHVARREGDLVGFVWIKRERSGSSDGDTAADTDASEGGDTQDEVYAVGTDPSAAGQGIAGALLTTALGSLQARGAREVTLYVEGDNASALALYEHLGFVISGRDLQFCTAA